MRYSVRKTDCVASRSRRHRRLDSDLSRTSTDACSVYSRRALVYRKTADKALRARSLFTFDRRRG
jgi:hypothetical protein